MPLYDKTCAHCGRVYTAGRAELARLRTCACGEALPAVMTVHTDRPDGRGAGSGSGDGAVPATRDHELVCPFCGHRHVGTREELERLSYCEACGDFLTGAQVAPISGAAAGDAAAGGPAALRPAPSRGPSPLPRELRLRMAGTDVLEPLPRTEGEGVFGRLTAEHPTLASLRTLSRRQFLYSYLEDGSLEIRNLSRFGTVVAGVRLTDADDVATVAPPAVIEMAGCAFELEGTDG